MLVDADALEEHVGEHAGQVLVVAGTGMRRIGEKPTTGTPASRRYRPSMHAGNTSVSNGASDTTKLDTLQNSNYTAQILYGYTSTSIILYIRMYVYIHGVSHLQAWGAPPPTPP